jgi:CRP-like cAMP-binding protein
MSKQIFDSLLEATDKVLEENQKKIAFAVIDSIHYFLRLTPYQRQRIKQAMTLVHFQPKSFICRQGTNGNTFYIVVNGSCKATQVVGDDSSVEEDVHMYEVGDHFELQSILDSGTYIRPYNVMTHASVTCYIISKGDFKEIISSGDLNLSHVHGDSLSKAGIADQIHLTGIRRITGLDENNHRNDEKSRYLLKRICKYLAESLWISQYWQMYREMMIVPSKQDEYGHLAHDIMQKHSFERIRAVDAIASMTKHILHKKPFDRSSEEIAFLVGLLKQKSVFLNKFCRNWTPLQFNLIAKKLKFNHVLPMHKITEAEFPATSAFMILKGCARVFTPIVSEVNHRRILKYEEDLCSGDLIGETVLGGITIRLQTVQAMTACELLVIEGNDFISVDERSNQKSIMLHEKFNFIQQMPIFHQYDPYELSCLANALQLEQIPKKTFVVKKGEVCEKFYLIYQGKFDIISDIDRKSSLASLQRFDYFGESSILRQHIHVSTGQRKVSGLSGKTIISGSYHFLECFDGLPSSSLEVLVLYPKDFGLIHHSVIKQLRKAYISRMKWRAERADIVYEEHTETARVHKALLDAALAPSDKATGMMTTPSKLSHDALSSSSSSERNHPYVSPSPSMRGQNFSPIHEILPMRLLRGVPKPPSMMPNISELPDLNTAINPITLLATSKNSVELKHNKGMLERSIRSKRNHTPKTTLNLGFSCLSGNPQRTIYLELAMNIRSPVSHGIQLPALKPPTDLIASENIQSSDTLQGGGHELDVYPKPSDVNQPSMLKSPETVQSVKSNFPEIKGAMTRAATSSPTNDPLTKNKISMVGSHRIPATSSYCEILTDREMFDFIF